MRNLTAAMLVFVMASTAMAQVPDSNSDVVPIMEGTSAPFDGLLVPEKRFVLFLKAEVAARDFELQLRIEKKYALAIEETYRKALKQARPWYREPWFVGSLLFLVGVGFTSLAVMVGVKVVQANK